MAQMNGATTRSRMLSCPQSDPASTDPPDYLTGKALQFWHDHAPALAQADMLSSQDKDSFALLCKIFALLDVAYAQAERDPSKLRQYLDLTGRYTVLAKMFCLFPTDRKKHAVSFKSQLDRHEEKPVFDF
jgi:phage terminase small subunit